MHILSKFPDAYRLAAPSAEPEVSPSNDDRVIGPVLDAARGLLALANQQQRLVSFHTSDAVDAALCDAISALDEIVSALEAVS